jgi:cytochrome c biogenesis protein CcmG, thiol:disulfide interchange protein DsbE
VKRALALALLALLLGCGGEREAVKSGQVGHPAPAYTLARLGGGTPVSGQAMAGRAYLINTFASWCTPCRAEHELLMQLEAQGVPIVGIAFKDAPEDAARYLLELGDPFHAVALDRDGRFALELGGAGVPDTFVIGADGAIRAVHRGPLTPEVVAREILPALRAR